MVIRLVDGRQESLLRLGCFPRPDVLTVAGFRDDVAVDEHDLAAEDDALDATGDPEAY